MKTSSLDFDAQALREKILDLAMRGKLVKQDPNDEPASVLLEKIKAEKEELVKEGKIKKSKHLPKITDDEMPFDIPDSWEWVRGEDIVSLIGDGLHGTPVFSKEGIPFVNGSNLIEGKISLTKSTKFVSEEEYLKYKKDLLPGTLFLSLNGTLGKVAKYHNEKIVLGKSAGYFSLIDLKMQDFIFYFLQSAIFKKYYDSKYTGSVIKNIPLKALRECIIPLPPLEEQSRIAAKIAQLFALLRKVESSTQQYAKLQTLLKSKVLDLAMRGKLVKQDPNDEPASVLLEKIKAEKEELIKEKKIKKSKPLPPITDEEKLFEIPDSWEWVRLGEILALEKGSIRRGPFGSSLKKAYFVPKSHNTYKVYEQGNAINHTIDYGSYYISAQKYDELKSFAIRPGDIIISGAGTIGKTYILPPESPEGVINQALIRMRLNNKLITNDFFLLLFKQKVSLLNKKAKGTAIKNMFSIAHMKEDIVWALPPISEQNRIVKQLQEISKMM